MARQITTVCVDPLLLGKCKKLGIAISPALNQLLKGLISQYDDSDMNIYELKKEQEELRTKILSLKEKEYELQAQITAFEEKQKQKKDTELKELLKKGDMIKRSGVLERA